jgi:acetyltransferase-like isoleucine patch superfamily enzyme
MISIDESAVVSPLADVEDSQRASRIIIGPESFVDSFVKIKAAGGEGDIIIGRRTFINSGCVLYIGNGIRIGNNVSIAANCVLAPTNHNFRDPDRPHQEQGFLPSKGGIMIDDDVWLGAGVVVLDGARIGRGAVVGAMSLVRGDVPPLGIFAGNPLRQIGTRRIQ